MAREGGVEPLAGSAAVGVGQDDCAFKHVGLLEVVGGQGNAPLCCAGGERGHQGAVAADFEPQRIGHGLAGKVVFSGAEAAHERQDVDAAKGAANGVDEVFLAVADDGFEVDCDADRVELFRQVEGVGVLAKGREHLRADGDDFSFHMVSAQRRGIRRSGRYPSRPLFTCSLRLTR